MATVLASDAEAFRAEVRAWLGENLVGEYRSLCGRNDLGDADEMAVRKAWEQQLAKGGWVGLSWPVEHGGRAATLTEELIFNEEYARADGPQRCGFFGEQLLGPTLMAFGTMAQRERFLGPILRAEEFWCQGFSEPDAGSDLANIKTTAVLDGDRWRINGQKVWTSLGHIADWIFVICRTEKADGAKHRGLTFLLCPMDQAGVDLRPIRQMTGSAEFNEVFFDDATTAADMVVGEIGGGWKTVMGTLGFERGTAFLAQQLRFAAEHAALVRTARSSPSPPRAGPASTPRPLVRGPGDHALDRDAHHRPVAARQAARPGSIDRQAAVVALAPGPHGPGDGRARCRRDGHGRR